MPNLFLTPNRLFFMLLSLTFMSALFMACNSAPSSSENQPTATATREPVVDPCATVTDAALIKEISDKIRTDPQFQSQLGHIAVNSKNRNVMLLGWAKGEAAVNTLSQYAGSVKCVAKVDNRLNTRLTVGCGNDQEDCPGVGCVPLGQCAPPVGSSSNSSPSSGSNN